MGSARRRRTAIPRTADVDGLAATRVEPSPVRLHAPSAQERHALSRSGTADPVPTSTIAAVAPVIGNRATAGLVSRMGDTRRPAVINRQTVPPTAAAAPAAAPGGPTAATPTTPAPARPVEIDGLTFNTASELGAWYVVRLGQLESSSNEIASAGEGYDAALGLTRLIGTAQMQECRNDPNAPASRYEALARQWRGNWAAAMNQAEDEKLGIAAAKLRAAQAQAQETVDSLDAFTPKLRDAQRDAFRAEDENRLLSLGDAIAGVLDCSLAAKNAVLTIAETVNDLRFATAAANAGAGMRVGIPVSNADFAPRAMNKVPKVLECLETINKAYAAFQAVRGVITLATGGTGTTEVARGGSMINATATLFSAGGTLVGAAAHVGLYANLYLGPMTAAAIKGVERLSRILSDDNQASIAAGYFGMVRWANEPGGRSMCEFMVRVMKASDSTEIPAPIPKAVLSYFDAQQDQFEAGVSTRTSTDAMPEEGWIFKDLDEPRMRSWLFRNRANVWAMLYGSTRVPDVIRESPLDH